MGKGCNPFPSLWITPPLGSFLTIHTSSLSYTPTNLQDPPVHSCLPLHRCLLPSSSLSPASLSHPIIIVPVILPTATNATLF